MSKGNTKTEGNKGNNFPWQWSMLQTLGNISDSVAPPSGLATEATAIAILNATVATQDIEILLVRDTVTDIVYKQVVTYTSGVPVVTYEAVDGTPFVPVNPMEYLDPSAVLNLMLVESIDQGTTLDSINGRFTPVVRTPGMLRVTSAGAATVTAGKQSVSFLNYGLTDATLLGQTLLSGEKLSWSVEDQKDTLGAFAYNADTSSLLITWTL